MSPHEKTRMVVVVALGLAALGGQWIALGIIGMGYLIGLGVASYRIQSNFFLRSINRIPTNKKSVVLSFDDGPSPEMTPQILDILKEYQCPAVFFCIGHKIAGNEALVQRMIAEGHLVANHSFSHSFWFDLYPSGRMSEELEATNEAILGAAGLRPKLFRPPYGVTNPMLAKAVRRTGLTSIGWSKRSLDTIASDPTKVMARITKKIKPGDIVLLHDTVRQGPELLRAYLEWLRQQGYSVERLDKIMDLNAYEKTTLAAGAIAGSVDGAEMRGAG